MLDAQPIRAAPRRRRPARPAAGAGRGASDPLALCPLHYSPNTAASFARGAPCIRWEAAAWSPSVKALFQEGSAWGRRSRGGPVRRSPAEDGQYDEQQGLHPQHREGRCVLRVGAAVRWDEPVRDQLGVRVQGRVEYRPSDGGGGGYELEEPPADGILRRAGVCRGDEQDEHGDGARPLVHQQILRPHREPRGRLWGEAAATAAAAAAAAAAARLRRPNRRGQRGMLPVPAACPGGEATEKNAAMPIKGCSAPIRRRA
eukprot:gene339-biopygen3013